MNFVFSDKFLNSSFKWHKNSGRLCFWNVTFSMLWDVKSTVISCFAEFKLGDFLLMLNTLSTSLELLENSVQMVLSKLQHAPEYFSLCFLESECYFHSRPFCKRKAICIFLSHTLQLIKVSSSWKNTLHQKL